MQNGKHTTLTSKEGDEWPTSRDMCQGIHVKTRPIQNIRQTHKSNILHGSIGSDNVSNKDTIQSNVATIDVSRYTESIYVKKLT